MKIDKFFRFFVVKEKKFYPLFIEQSRIIKESAALLKELFSEDDREKRLAIYKEIKHKETDCDVVTSTIYDELNRTLVTPFDREDIHNLASKTDTFLDFIHDSARKQVMYSPKYTHDGIVKIVDSITKLADIIEEIMKNLEFLPGNGEIITEKYKQIKYIEHQVDEIYENFISYLFEEEKDAIELVKSKNIVQGLEDSTDKAKDLSDVVRAIIIKQA